MTIDPKAIIAQCNRELAEIEESSQRIGCIDCGKKGVKLVGYLRCPECAALNPHDYDESILEKIDALNAFLGGQHHRADFTLDNEKDEKVFLLNHRYDRVGVSPEEIVKLVQRMKETLRGKTFGNVLFSAIHSSEWFENEELLCAARNALKDGDFLKKGHLFEETFEALFFLYKDTCYTDKARAKFDARFAKMIRAAWDFETIPDERPEGYTHDGKYLVVDEHEREERLTVHFAKKFYSELEEVPSTFQSFIDREAWVEAQVKEAIEEEQAALIFGGKVTVEEKQHGKFYIYRLPDSQETGRKKEESDYEPRWWHPD